MSEMNEEAKNTTESSGTVNEENIQQVMVIEQLKGPNTWTRDALNITIIKDISNSNISNNNNLNNLYRILVCCIDCVYMICAYSIPCV